MSRSRFVMAIKNMVKDTDGRLIRMKGELDGSGDRTSATGECVDDEAYDEAADNANDGGNWYRCGGLTQRDTTYKDDCFHA